MAVYSRYGRIFLAHALILLAVFLPAAGANADTAQGRWYERSQLVWNAATRQMERRVLKVWDVLDRADQEFYWEPDAGAGDIENGPINGSGTLVWRERGSPAYDRTAIISTYRGTLRNGAPHGQGRLSTRDGRTYRGEWREGEMLGRGDLRYANGDRYEGELAHGVPHGRGRFARADGEIFEGSFRHGSRHGRGELTTPGGTVHVTEWSNGIELPKSAARRGAVPPERAVSRPDDYQLAAVGAVDLDKVNLSVIVDQSLSKQQQQQTGGVIYVHNHTADETVIEADDPTMLKRWKGGDVITGSWLNTSAPAYLKLLIRNDTGRRLSLSGAYLEIEESATDLQPFVGLDTHWGCIGYRPSFNLVNNGWGAVEDARLDFTFVNPARELTPFPDRYTIEIGSIDAGDGRDVVVEPALRAASVDVDRLKTARYSCPSYEQLEGCGADFKRKLSLGKLIRHIAPSGLYMQTSLIGDLSYTWHDSKGVRHRRTSPLQTLITLAFIEVPSYAECGGDDEFAVEVADVPKLRFSLDKQNYRIEVPLQGSSLIRRIAGISVAALADKASQHRFRFVVVLADGSQKASPPIQFNFYRPKPSNFKSGIKLPACYIVESSC